MNNRILLIILVALLAIYGLTQIFSGKRERSFNADLIQLDTARVTSVVITPKTGDEPITLKREGQQWIASQGEKNVPALDRPVTGLLGALASVRTRRIAAKSTEKWPEYEVEEGKATRIQVYEAGDLLEDFLLGRFDFNQQTRSATSYLRLTGEDEVYAVDGFLTMSFPANFDAFRNKTVVRLQREMTIDAFRQTYPDTTYAFEKTATGWTLANAPDLPLDSMAVENYLNVLRNLTAQNFADDFDELAADQLPQYAVTLEGENIAAPLTVNVYRDTTRAMPFVIRSALDPDTYFAGDSSGVFAKLFKPVEEMAAKAE